MQFENVNLSINERLLLENINLEINPGEVHVIMGQNGVGKSSLAKAIMGDNNYQVTGKIIYQNQDLTKLNISERSKLGIYVINQMLRMALSSRTNSNVDIFKFRKELEEICQKLELDKSFIHREINVGCSGGERKKIELMHMWMLKPSFIILDEIDSGLDVDALKIVKKSIKEYYDEYHPAILIISHSNTITEPFSKRISNLYLKKWI